MQLDFGDVLMYLAIPVTAIVARLFSNAVVGIIAGIVAGFALVAMALTHVAVISVTDLELEVLV